MKPDRLHKDILPAWNFAERLYHSETHLYYDYLASEDTDGATKHLPTLEEIKAQAPNPCGWGSGMEDSVLNGSNMLEAILATYNRTKDESLKAIADDIFKGLHTCATVSKQNGYLARSVSPLDGKSHFMNSSRDQYTHWVYIGYVFYNHPLCDEDQKEKIKKVLVSFAEKTERDVTEENGYCLLREDDKPADVCCMYGPSVVMHECMRLPMFYLAAYHVSKDEHWKEMYLKYRDWATLGSEKILEDNAFRIFEYAYALLQMQYSLKLVYELEEDENYKDRYLKMMQRVAEHVSVYTQKAIQPALERKDIRPVSWRQVKANYLGFHYGKAFYVPFVSSYECKSGETSYFVLMRNGAEALIIQALCPNFQIPKEQIEKFKYIVQNVKFENATYYWPILYCDAWALLEEKELL